MIISPALSAQLPIPSHETFNILDSSKLKEFMDCPRKYFFHYVLGWQPDKPNNHLEFGTAWHAALEHLALKGYTELELKEAFKLFLLSYREHFPPESDGDMAPKDPGNAATALWQYANIYNKNNYEVLYTEISFKVPIDDEGTELTGRIDRIYRDKETGKVYAMDHKTSKKVDKLWEEQWDLDQQMGTYYHAMLCCTNPEDFGGVVVDGSFFKKGGNEFKQKVVKKIMEMSDAWLSDTKYWVGNLKAEFVKLAADSQEQPKMRSFPRNPQSCTKYFGCEYRHLCSVWPNPLTRCDTPPPGFKQEWWDPTAREKPAKAVLEAGEIHKVEEENNSVNLPTN